MSSTSVWDQQTVRPRRQQRGAVLRSEFCSIPQDPTYLDLFAEYTAVQNALAQGITVFAATGNNGSTTGISSPACLSGVISVGATYARESARQPRSGTYRDNNGISWPACFDEPVVVDDIACFSNANVWTDIVAPGVPVVIAGTSYGGTSQSSPHAAGVAALMLQAEPDLTPAKSAPC